MQAQNQTAKLNVYRDENAENPRDWDNSGTMVCWHRRYTLGDKHNYSDPREFMESLKAKSAYAILPVYLYDHSILKLSNKSFIGHAQHAGWDSGQVGYIYIEKEKVKELTGFEPTESNKKSVQEILSAETELYSAYIEGDCYGFSIEDMQGNILDSCGGFYGGNMSKVLESMKEHVKPEYALLFDKMQSYVKTLYSAMT